MPGTFLFVTSFRAAPDGALQTFRWHEDNCVLEPLQTVPIEASLPLYVESDPLGRLLFVTDCGQPPQWIGGLNVFAIDGQTRALTSRGRRATGGIVGVHVAVAADGKWAIVPNCGPFNS